MKKFYINVSFDSSPFSVFMSIVELPSDVLWKIVSFLKNSDVLNFSLTCKKTHSFFNNVISD